MYLIQSAMSPAGIVEGSLSLLDTLVLLGPCETLLPPSTEVINPNFDTRTDYDARHISEELHNAATSGPVAIFQAVLVTWVFGVMLNM